MNSADKLIQESILRDMSEGVMTIGTDGIIGTVNPAAGRILGLEPGELAGRRFAACFIGQEENDAFNQSILDAIYDPTAAHENIVPYSAGAETRQLHVTTSFLRDGDKRAGVIAVLRDITELAELRDAVKAMQQIQALNGKLELRNRLLGETFGRFLSDEIVRQLLDTPDGLALGGKKRTLTILMSDLRGFTALSERMDAEALISMLNHYLGEMTEIIQRRNGTIIEFIGDGIFAIFGAPAPSETHAADAVTAAVEMQARMASVNTWNAARGLPALEMGIGISTGEVIVGNIGSEKRTKYGVVGSQVNLCGRIESYTVGGEILISPETRTAIREPLDVTELREVRPKGVAEPLTLSSVAGIGALTCRRAEDMPSPLARPLPVRFQTIHEKHTGAEMYAGAFTALSPTGAVLDTDTALQPYENLQVEAEGFSNLFCKVLARQSGGWLLRFTAIPEGFDDFLSGLI